MMMPRILLSLSLVLLLLSVGATGHRGWTVRPAFCPRGGSDYENNLDEERVVEGGGQSPSKEEWFDDEAMIPEEENVEETEATWEVDEEEEPEEEEFLADPTATSEIQIEMSEEYNTMAAQDGEEAFHTEAVTADPVVDEQDSSTYVDRMDLADAYDEEEVESGGTLPVADPATSPATFTALRKLKYKRSEIKHLLPAKAAIIAHQQLERPLETKLPDHWFRGGVQPPVSSGKKVLNILPKVILPVLIGAVAVTKGPSVWAEWTSKLAEGGVLEDPLPPVATSNTIASTDRTTATTTMDPAAAATTTTQPPQPEHHSHTNMQSLHPGQTAPSDEELDETWLDKLITAVENKIKAFLRWEI